MKNTLTDRQVEILEEYKRCRSPFRTARVFNLDVHEVWQLIEDNQSYLQNPPERYEGWGRPEIRDFVAARRRIRGPKWDNDAPEVSKARELYEEGWVDLATGRDGGWEILYAIPRKKRQPRPGCWVVESIR